MDKQVRWIVLASIAAALVVFLVVQDRITAAGARGYVQQQRAAGAGQTAPTIDEVMRPAVHRSIRVGALSGGAVLAAGLAAAAVSRVRGRARR